MGKELTLDIPYIKLKFYAVIAENSILPADKVSALRGGMGQMMLRQHCAADRNCDACRFTKGCIIRNAFYSRMDTYPPYVTGQESVGYLLECEDRKEEYSEGDILYFRMILFGDSITYFFVYLQALVQLGAEGLGKYKARFQIAEVRNARDRAILSGNSIDKSEYCVDNVADYVRRRKRHLQFEGVLSIEFQTPLSMKYRGEYLQEFVPQALIDGACRRIQMLNYYTGQETELPELQTYPVLAGQTVFRRSIQRYSSTHDAKVKLYGIAGRVLMTGVSEQCLDYLLAGELVHIGKNTSFGFGKYIAAKA